MNKNILLAVALTATLAACGDSCKAYTDKVNAATDTPCGNYMTNEEIIAVTKQCEDAGLNAMALHCGSNDHTTTSVQCEPIQKG